MVKHYKDEIAGLFVLISKKSKFYHKADFFLSGHLGTITHLLRNDILS